MAKRIPIKDAKEELIRINNVLTEPHILIGGLAVNQYHISRDSSDIDLVIESDTAKKIIKDLYPSLHWDTVDKNDDEIRPSFEIVNRTNHELVIKFGPKILQRQPYNFIDWKILFEGANKFKYMNSELDKILVPSVVNLSFTKLISYLSRKDSNHEKALVDLDDFCNLTNNKAWNTIDFYTIISATNAFNYLKDNLKFSKTEKGILEKSSLYQLINIFRQPTEAISKLPNPTDIQKKRVENAIAGGESFLMTQEKKEIGAIGIDLVGFTAINMKYGPELGDKIIEIISQLINKADLNQHKVEVIGDTFIVYLTIEDNVDLEKNAAKLQQIIHSHNWSEIQDNLFVSAYTTFDFIKEKESIHDFSKRIFDSILNQKEQGHIFRKSEDKISRKDWDIEEMVSHV